jgi:uroporphyrinogen decarboxylase
VTPRARSLAAIRGERPDTVPIQMDNFLVCAQVTGRPYGEVFRDASLLAESQMSGQALLGHDIIDVETGIAALAEACGCTVEYPADSAPWIRNAILHDLSPEEIGRYLSRVEVPVPARSSSLLVMIDAVHILASCAGERFLVKAEADQGPFSLAAQLRGMDQFLLDVADRAEHVEDLLAFTTEVCRTYACALSEAGADVVVTGDSFSGPDVLSPGAYGAFAFPYQKRLYDSLRTIRARKSLHICGNVDAIVERMTSTGADILEIDEKTDLHRASSVAAGKVCLLGAVSPRLLRAGGLQEIQMATRRVLESMAGNPRFILSPGCSLPGDTPIENIRAFIDAGRAF